MVTDFRIEVSNLDKRTGIERSSFSVTVIKETRTGYGPELNVIPNVPPADVPQLLGIIARSMMPAETAQPLRIVGLDALTDAVKDVLSRYERKEGE